MKLLSRNRVLYIAIAVSVLVHVALLSAKFDIKPLSFDLKKNTSIELVLVNPSSGKVADLAFSAGNNKSSDVTTSRIIARAAGLESGVTGARYGKNTETRRQARSVENRNPSLGKKTENMYRGKDEVLQGDIQDSRSLVFRKGAIKADGNNREQNVGKRPVITANTRDVGYAMYYKALSKRVENMGFVNFPQQNGTRLYGELTVRIPVYYDGSLFEKEGGPSIERSSGNPVLDKAALNIIRRAAPFGPFPKSMRSVKGGADVWIIVTRLRFAREGVQSQVHSTVP